MRRWVVLLAAVGAVLMAARPGFALEEGAAWGVVPSPNRGIHENELAGLAVIAPDDIWAVGRYNSGRPPTATGRDTLALHWDGTAWAGVPTPNPTWSGADFFTLEDADAVSSTEVWAVGYAEDFASLKSTTLVERWNGHTWAVEAIAGTGSGAEFSSVVAGGNPKRVWACGSYANAATISRTLTERRR